MAILRMVMVARGFPSRWIQWIDQLLSTASSRVMVNGTASDIFQHKQGLRQGDSLSSMLFIIAVDVLQQMVGVLNNTVTTPIAPKIRESILALQYADDTAFIVSADQASMITFKIMLRLFTKMSGLEINFQKSSFVSFNMNPDQTEKAATILGCTQTELPVMYLGMPLTVSRPNRAMFMPLIEKMERRLQGWKEKMLSRGGRMQLVKGCGTHYTEPWSQSR